MQKLAVTLAGLRAAWRGAVKPVLVRGNILKRPIMEAGIPRGHYGGMAMGAMKYNPGMGPSTAIGTIGFGIAGSMRRAAGAMKAAFSPKVIRRAKLRKGTARMVRSDVDAIMKPSKSKFKSLKTKNISKESIKEFKRGATEFSELHGGKAYIKGSPHRFFSTSDLAAGGGLPGQVEGFRKAAKGTTAAGKEAFNRTIGIHESIEAKKIPMNIGKAKFLSHGTVYPMLSDVNIANTLTGPGSEMARSMRALRRPEVNLLAKSLPGGMTRKFLIDLVGAT